MAACTTGAVTQAVVLGGGPAPTYGINQQNTNVSPYVGVESDPFIRWVRSVDISALSSPSIIIDERGVLYLAGNQPVHASTGAPVAFTLPSQRDSTPAIDQDGNIYQWVSGRMRSFTSNGTPRWTGPTTNSSDGNGVRILPNGTIVGSAVDNQLYAYSPQNGAQLWAVAGEFRLPPPVVDHAGNIYLARGHSASVAQYISYDQNGNQRWSVPGNRTNTYAAMRLGPDGNLYSSEYYGTEVTVFNATTGQVVRQQPNLYGGIQAISAQGTLYSCSYQTVRATDLLGNTQWQASIPQGIFFSNLVVDASGKVYCTTEQNHIYAYSSTGQYLWSMQLQAAGFSSLSPVIGSDGSLYVRSGSRLYSIGGIVPAPGAASVLLTGALFACRRRRRATFE
jgi:outer membrane protein assembly factor BamB